MFRSSYAFTMSPKVMQVVSHAGRGRTHRTAPLGSNTLKSLSRISTTKRDEATSLTAKEFVRAVAFMPNVKRADWSFKKTAVRPGRKLVL